MHFCLTFSLVGLIFRKWSQIKECNALQLLIPSTEAWFEPQSPTYLCRRVSFLICNTVLYVYMTKMRVCRPLIQKRTMPSYFWHQKSIPRPQISGIWYFERQNRTRTVEIMANVIFKQIPIHFFVKLLHKLQPPGGTIFHKSDPPFFWLKIIIGYVCTFCERPRLIQQHFLKTSHPTVTASDKFCWLKYETDSRALVIAQDFF